MSYMNPIHLDTLKRESLGPLANYYFSYDDALAQITRFMNGDIKDWEIITLTQMMSEDPGLKDLMEKHDNHLKSEPLPLLRQDERVQNALRKLALGTPQVATMTVDEFDALMMRFDSLSCLDWEETRNAQKQWRTAFVEHQKQSPTYVRSLLEFEDHAEKVSVEELSTTPLFNATAYREEILDLLTSNEAKDKWFANTVELDITWTLENVKRFPLRLSKVYIEDFLQAKHGFSVKSQDILERVREVADKRLVHDVRSAMKSMAEESFYDSEEDDQTENDGTAMFLLTGGSDARDRKFDMTQKETLLVMIALIWSQRLQQEIIKEGRNEMNWQRALLQAIYRHTARVNRCPPGSKICVLEATKKEVDDDGDNHDLSNSIFQRYEEDPISAVRETSRRYLLFRYGNHRAMISRHRRCERTNSLGIEFPDLCYVFVTKVEIVYHQSPWVQHKIDEDEDKVTFEVETGTSSLPFSSYLFSRAGKGGDQNEDDENTCQKKELKLNTKTIAVLDEEKKLCKWIQVETNTYVTIHDIRVYGKAVLLM